MTRREMAWWLGGCALLSLLAAAACFYKAINFGVTAEEGLRYSIPGMKGSGTYSAAQIKGAEAAFRTMDRMGDRWSDAAGGVLLLCVITGGAGVWMLRSKTELA